MSSAKLSASRVYRGGVTAPSMNFETAQVKIGTTQNTVRLSFEMSSKGGGTSRVWVELGAQDFSEIVAKMVDTHREAAMVAMAAELSRQVSEQPAHDERISRRAMEEVRQAAEQQYHEASTDNDHAERFILDSVTNLIKKIQGEKGDKKRASSIAA